jgi:hypothetical protein
MPKVVEMALNEVAEHLQVANGKNKLRSIQILKASV